MNLPFRIPNRPNLPFRGVENDEKAFRPLNHEVGEIRCVVLLPGSGDDPIACELVYTNINKDSATRIDYIALSYCWGDIGDTMEILLHGPSIIPSSSTDEEQTNASFRITRNLHVALKTLRSDERQHLWIDAICINQQNLEEKTHQVRLMAKIYSSAESVLVWLGPHDLSSRFLMRVWTMHLENPKFRPPSTPSKILPVYKPESKSDPIEKINVLRPAWWNDAHPLWEDVAQDQVFSQIELEHLGETPEDCSPSLWRIRIRDSLENILGRPWWSRIWVVQEVFLASKQGGGDRQVKFRIGDDTLRWKEMVNLVNLVSDVTFLSDIDKVRVPVTPDRSQIIMSRKRSLILEDQLGMNEAKSPRTDSSSRSSVNSSRSPALIHQLELNNVRVPFTSSSNRTIGNPWRTLILTDTLNMEKDILSLLTITSGFHASDPRDKLFALLQLATDTRQAMAYDPLISPDYTKPAKAVFDDLIRWKPDLGRRGYARVYRDSFC